MTRSLLIAFLLNAVAAAAPQQQVPTSIRLAPTPLSPEDVQRMEDQLRSDPRDIQSRNALLQFYFAQIEAQGSNATAALREARFQHIRWLIEHQPESGLTGSTAATLMTGAAPDPEHYGPAKTLWLQQVQAHPQNAKVLMNAAAFLRQQDPREALELLRQAHAIGPEDAAAAGRLGALLGYLAVHGPPDLSSAAINELQSCTEVNVCSDAALVLISDGQSGPPGMKALARTLLQRAHAAEPMNLLVTERLNMVEEPPHAVSSC